MIALQNFTCKPVKTKPYSVYYVNEILKKFQAFQSSDSKNNDTKDPDKESKSKLTLPPEPQNCCMSGCSNCVWVAYAEEVAKLIDDGGETAKKKIMENVKDPNLRAFLLLELSHLFKKGK